MLADHVDTKRSRKPARIRVVFAVAITGALALSLSVFGGLGYAASAVKQTAEAVVPAAHDSDKDKNKDKDKDKVSSAKGQYGDPVVICHHNHTITINAHALPAHLAHGDTIGPC